MKEEAKVSGDGWGASFSANEGYQVNSFAIFIKNQFSFDQFDHFFVFLFDQFGNF